MSFKSHRAAIAAALSLGLVAGVTPASAAGIGPSSGAAISADSLVTQVHAGHGRRCTWGPVHRWGNERVRHRHIGRDVRVCGKRWRGRGRPDRWEKRGCFRIGPVWYCP